MAHRITFTLAAFAAAPYAIIALAGQQPAPKVKNASEALTLFKAHCVTCHSGTDAPGGLSLSSIDGLRKGGVSGKLFIPGDSKNSLIMQRIRGQLGKPQMPMGFAPLVPEDADKIARWIDSGASLDPGEATHWAYRKPKMPAPPLVKLRSWVRNPIDAFVLARLEKERLQPSPEASRETLIRRVSLDLTGLPPTIAEIDAFVNDKKPGAYERVVDRLLSSKHYGERQALPWLDLSRYADSDGYEKDLSRTSWKYRDWLIQAFNRNEPYNQFIVDQIAGDLLPHPSTDELIATGFNRNTMFNREGGVDQAEAHFNVVVDRVGTTATVFLGSTLQCARCHDHKYDPFTQRDFYRMAAFFDNSAIYPRGPKDVGEEKWFEAELRTPSPEQSARERKLSTDVVELKRRIDTDSQSLGDSFASWKRAAGSPAEWSALPPSRAVAESGAKLEMQKDGSVLATGQNSPRDTYSLDFRPPAGPLTALRIEALTDPSLTAMGPGRADNGNFVLTGVSASLDKKPVDLVLAATDYAQRDFDPAGVLAHNKSTGWAISGAMGKPHELILLTSKPIDVKAGEVLHLSLEQQSPYVGHNLGRFRISTSASEAPTVEVAPEAVRSMLRTGKLDDSKLLAYYRTVAPSLGALRVRLSIDQKELSELDDQIPTALVMRDNPVKGPLKTHVHTRGEFLSPAEEVEAGVPKIFAQLTKEEPQNRLGLAEWLASKDNPLTARVQVNRLWEQCFGRGIVETSEDFGTQGSPPSHPELLDWLACKLMAENWNLKAINRLIVTSATYRQSSRATEKLLRDDPQNILLARGPRFRLDAEAIRDTELTAAGLLDPEIGGPSVFPYQPDGVWDNPFSDEKWPMSTHGEQYRRGLYTFWKRTSPYPSFLSLDATSRESCTVRRIRTNTPLQALALLNDTATFDAAKALAKRMMGAGADDKGISLGFRLCTSRRPEASEKSRLLALLGKERQRYRADRKRAGELAGGVDAAAWTMVANVLLNLDETITKQ